MDAMSNSDQTTLNGRATSKRSLWIGIACISAGLGAFAAATAAITVLGGLAPTVLKYSLAVLLFVVSALMLGAGWAMWRFKSWGALLYLGIGLALFVASAGYRASHWGKPADRMLVEMLIDVIGLALLLVSFLLTFYGAWRSLTKR